MALTKAELASYEAKLKGDAQARATALASDAEAKSKRVAVLQAKWRGLADQEKEIGDRLVADANFKADASLLSEIDSLKKSVKAELAAFGVTV